MCIKFKAPPARWRPLLFSVVSSALAFVVQSPNFFGVLEDKAGLSDDAFCISVCAEAQSLGLVEPLPADISVGEMQSLGIPPHLGGPTAGFFATRREHVRRLPGRLVGRTKDPNSGPPLSTFVKFGCNPYIFS